MKNLTVGIATWNRPAALERCIRSLHVLAPLTSSVVVFDNGSEPPASIPQGLVPKFEIAIIRDGQPGPIVGRNRIVRESATPYILLLDDDAVVMSAAAI